MGTIDTIESHGQCSRPASLRDYVPKWTGNAGWFSHALSLIDLWIDRRRGRIALAQMSEQGLRDIGVGVSQAEFEASRPFWEGTSDYR